MDKWNPCNNKLMTEMIIEENIDNYTCFFNQNLISMIGI